MAVPAPPPSAPQRTGSRKSASTITTAQRGLNRNLLVLGVVTLVVLGGVAAFLASKNGGNIFNTFQNITNQIIHNSYFTQLIASGATTEKDLEDIAEIRPYGDGFIGISKEAFDWEQAQDLAKRTGAQVLAVDAAGIGSKPELLTWLGTTFSNHLSAPTWVRDRWDGSVLAGLEVLAVKELDGSRKVLLHWQAANPALTSATKEAPFVNSLGMKFVPVPSTDVLFCIHETRREDYAAYAAQNPQANSAWSSHFGYPVPKAEKPMHPVISVNRHDAESFCTWLSTKEGIRYRLPKDREWSLAVGIGSREDPSKSIADLSNAALNQFPWGDVWPPMSLAGNFCDEDAQKAGSKDTPIKGYADAWPFTAPVMSFAANPLGIYDLGGNVWEWCADEWISGSTDGICRGGSFRIGTPRELRSSHRDPYTPEGRGVSTGFRIVVEVGAPATKTSNLNQKKFGGSRYELVPGSLAWEEAEQKAREMGGHLATITSKEENDWILKMYGGHTPKHRTHFWIGAKEETKGSGWRWVTGEPFEFTSWNKDEPNYGKGTPPFYLNVYHSRTHVIGWNDRYVRDGYADGLVGFLVEWDDAK